MKNPWSQLPSEPPYVLPIDRAALGSARGLQLDAIPVPWVGSPAHAGLYVLLLNPGLADDEERNSAYSVAQNRRALLFESEHPFWSLDPALSKIGGYRWWRPRLRRLADEVGWDVLRKRMMCVQYFPYHSRTFSSWNVRLPSQQFSFGLVRDAIADGKPVIITRSFKLWIDAVPELVGHPYYRLHNPRSVFFTPNNMDAAAFSDVVRRLKRRGS